MSTYTEEVGKKLNALLEKTFDAEKGFKKAAKYADSPDLKAYFERKATERYRFGRELKTEITNFGREADEKGSFSGTVHRGWMDVKAFFSADNDEAMLEEAITGEKEAVDEYKEVLRETGLPPSTATLLTQQMNKIAVDLAAIKRLEDIS